MVPLELLILKSLDAGPNHSFGITRHVQEASGGAERLIKAERQWMAVARGVARLLRFG